MQIANRFKKIRGLDYSEKRILVRIGELIDGALNNRGPANPAALSPLRKLIRSRKLPPPRNLRSTVGVRSAKIEWDPVDSPILLMYEIQLVNTATNLTTFHSAFTTRHYIGQSGTFRAKVRSVSRNGFASPYNFVPITFTVQDDVLYLEGNKHEPTLQSYIISEDIFTPEEYKVFCWTGYTLNTFANSFSNPEFFTDFSRASLYPIFSRLLMPRESISLSNVAPGVLSTETRPSVRTEGLFESPFGAMFKPFPISSTDLFKDQENVFFVFNERDDNAGLSMSLLSIPALVKTVEVEEDLPGYSIDFSGGVGADEQMRTTAATTVGRETHKWLYPATGQTANFAIEMWFKNEEPSDTVGSNMIVVDHPSGAGTGGFSISRSGSVVGDSGFVNGLRIFFKEIFGPGQAARAATYTVDLWGNTNWHQIVVVVHHTGATAQRTFNVYFDGQNLNWPQTGGGGGGTIGNWDFETLPFGGANSQSLNFANIERQLRIGGELASSAQWLGLWYSLASWRAAPLSSVALDDDDIRALYNNPRKDRRSKFSDYDKRKYLVHYYLPAFARESENDSDLGIDWGPGPPDRPLSGLTNITIENDLVGDAPGTG